MFYCLFKYIKIEKCILEKNLLFLNLLFFNLLYTLIKYKYIFFFFYNIGNFFKLKFLVFFKKKNMIIGNGLIAKSFKKKKNYFKNVIIFASGVSNSKNKTSNLIKVYNFNTSWCGYSVRFQPEWKKFEEEINSINNLSIQAFDIKCDNIEYIIY